MIPQPVVTPQLLSWDDVRNQAEWSGLLLGNGSSRAVWGPFRYSSLLDKASSNQIAHPLDHSNQAVFAEFQTENFEAVLSRLRDASKICAALGLQFQVIDNQYEAIKAGLIEAVHAVHLDWVDLPDPAKKQMRESLLPFEYVYSTNYDLLLYWAMMTAEGGGFTDYFWNAGLSFDPTNTEVWAKCTKVLYLHGGLHIYRLPSGQTVKRTAEIGNLLEVFGTPFQGVEIPLFISEGHARDKLAAIRRSDYLSFAFAKFGEHRGSLVVFGHALGEPDEHLVRAISQFRRLDVPTIAISIFPDTPQNIVARKAVLHQQLPGKHLLFFNARSHPLGADAMSVHA